MARLASIDPIVAEAIRAGGRFVVYPYCVSILILSFKRASHPVFVPTGTRPRGRGRYVLISAMVGWWGLPWGVFWTIECLSQTLRGGVDVTGSVVRALAGDMMAPG